MPALRPERAGLSVFPLAGPLPSTDSAAADAALFAGFAGTTGPCDCPPSFISGLRPQPSPSGPSADRQLGDVGLSRFSRIEVPSMPWFFDSAGPTNGSRVAPFAVLPSGHYDGVGTPDF